MSNQNRYKAYTKVVLEKAKINQVKHAYVRKFDDKYGDKVRMVTIQDQAGSILSQELCGGTHIKSTSAIGVFHITSCQSIGSGIKRIEAITGSKALAYYHELEHEVHQLEQQLSMPLGKINEAYQKLLKQDRRKGTFLEKALQAHGGQCLKESTHDGLRYIQWEAHVIDPNTYRKACKAYLGNHPDIDVLWGATQDNEGSMVTVFLFCSQAAIAKGVQAGAEIQAFAARCASKGGGKPDFASCSVAEAAFKQHWGTILS